MGTFHTHPNPASEGWETGPSTQDGAAAAYSGVPWLIRAEDGDHLAGPDSRRGAPAEVSAIHYKQPEKGDDIMATASSPEASLAVADVLRIAHLDAQAVYRNLSEFKITLCRCPDGWHVDYDLTDPLAAGGGPHYVIDPNKGEIVTRRYEQ